MRVYVSISQSRGRNSLGSLSCLKIKEKYFLVSRSNNEILTVKPLSDSLVKLLNKGFGHIRLIDKEMRKPEHAITLKKDIEDKGYPAVLWINFAIKNKNIHNNHIRLLSEERLISLANPELKASYNWLNLFAKVMYEKLAITTM